MQPIQAYGIVARRQSAIANGIEFCGEFQLHLLKCGHCGDVMLFAGDAAIIWERGMGHPDGPGKTVLAAVIRQCDTCKRRVAITDYVELASPPSVQDAMERDSIVIVPTTGPIIDVYFN